jgi:hypothetical protein
MLRHLALFAALTFAAPALAQEPPEPDAAQIERLLQREQEILDQVKLRAPDRYAELIALRASDRGAYLRYLFRAARVLRHAGDREEPSPELIEQRTRLEAVRAKYPDGLDDLSKKDLAAVRAEVAEIAAKIFEIKQTQRRARIEGLRQDLTELEADVARRDQERDQILQDFVDAFLRGPVDL